MEEIIGGHVITLCILYLRYLHIESAKKEEQNLTETIKLKMTQGKSGTFNSIHIWLDIATCVLCYLRVRCASCMVLLNINSNAIIICITVICEMA